MNSAPITTWEGATAYFTFADSPGVLALCLLGSLAVCIYAIASMVKHENESYRKLKEEGVPPSL
ncbi:MAG: hypothetical protein KF810_12030 [Rhizobiaceae bacterium]|nr:hypothetical protein [Rhizobiaceae bacterium]